MNQKPRMVAAVVVATVVFALAQNAEAQFRRIPGMQTLFGAQPVVALALLEEVQKDLGVNDEVKEKVGPLFDEMFDERRAIFQDAAGDFDYAREESAKLQMEMRKKLFEALSEAQQKRLVEIYVQVNGPLVLTDEPIGKALELTKEQQEKIAQARQEQMGDVFGMFQDLQGMDDEEAKQEVADAIKTRNEELLAILTEEQREAFAKMKGKELKIDLEKLPGFGGRNAD